MTLFDWAKRHNISPVALQELVTIFGIAPNVKTDLSEEAVQQRVRLEASRIGARLWRNNTGVDQSEGRHVRYGLCNESHAMNMIVKSSDLIGIKPVLIRQDMIGQTIGQFMAREVKRGNWKYTGTDREVAQLKFLQVVNAMGGDGKFVSGSEL